MPNESRPRSTSSRKKQHVRLALTRDVGFRKKGTGLDHLDFEHNALPEIDFSEVDTSTRFLGHELSCPLLISSMTGGYADALTINRQLAEVCAEMRIALGVGSQRQAMERKTLHRTFSVIREVAPDIPVIGNLGAAEVARLRDADSARRLVDLVHADAFAIHLNPLQELLQPEGNPAFRGVLEGIALLVRELSVPVIVKEIGAGISGEVAARLIKAGVAYIDVAGAGGTSWAGIEILRSKRSSFRERLWDWGIPTASALREVTPLKKRSPGLTIIASGGIGSGMDAAKCLALGADMVGSARPMLHALVRGKKRGLKRLLQEWTDELRRVMFLTGAKNIKELQTKKLVARHPL
jgi:isopentenyl-diphosphate delta-isomerase